MKKLYPVLLIFVQLSCTSKTKIDLLVYNATIYTVDSAFSVAEAMAVNNGKIVETGNTADLEKKYDATERIDAQGKFIYPGFNDAHSHFTEYGFDLHEVHLTGTTNWDEIIEKVKTFAKENPHGWLIGNGWDQNDWPNKQFPSNEKLNELFPDRPVYLSRIDSHAAIANQKALDMAGVRPGDKLDGGVIETKKGKLTGILIDNATALVYSKIPEPTAEQTKEALQDAQENCFADGLTTVSDCGLDYPTILFIDSLQKKGDLKIKVYAMLSDSKKNLDFAFTHGKIKTGRLSVYAFKFFADGALGSRGACLLQPYSDKPGWFGFLLSPQEHFDSAAKIISEKGWQMCTHAIGDSGNRMILHIYAKYLKGKNDLRWRIEHAQIINENDFKLFGDYNIIPSMQPTHATSDMYWAGGRLGEKRLRNAYALKRLLQQNGWEPLGTDFPVEDISPIKTFYAAVVRKDEKSWPETGFQMENALSRKEALKGMTIWAAKAQFDEDEKGSLEKGKSADFIILDHDLMKEAPEKLLQVQVLKTYISGEKVFEKK
ncbi:MAG: amidohydrolase [Bacteroidetes bacterium]|nr:amidohydrolase [Bacteroidota bacterium]